MQYKVKNKNGENIVYNKLKKNISKFIGRICHMKEMNINIKRNNAKVDIKILWK